MVIELLNSGGYVNRMRMVIRQIGKWGVVCVVCSVLGSFAPCWGTELPPAPAEGKTASVESTVDYRIGPGDMLDVSVWKDEALTRTTVVLPDGKITFPLIGEVIAGGKTVAGLKEELTQRLTRYVPDLVLSVEVKQSNSMMVYVIGRVNTPGRLVLNTRINVLQALAMAGGFNPYASKDRVKIFRQEHGVTRILPFHYTDVIDGERLLENIELQRGDVIVVP